MDIDSLKIIDQLKKDDAASIGSSVNDSTLNDDNSTRSSKVDFPPAAGSKGAPQEVAKPAKELRKNEERDPPALDARTTSPFPSDEETMNEETNPLKSHRLAIEDWSQTGRGSHVEFKHSETVPLVDGRWLGRGVTGDVYETKVQGWQLAHKKLVVKRKLADKEKREIEILKRLSSHVHMIQLVGTYTHRNFLGLLLYPVAVCDMYTFFEDVEAWSDVKAEYEDLEDQLDALDSVHKERLTALGYDFPAPNMRSMASPIYSKMGCLISAIAYLHDQKIRHKDLKPSNILLSRDKLWLSDFGSATDFSLLSQSATDNERGTARYFSPEVATWKPNGRAADIFALGCVLLEIIVLHDRGTLDHIRHNRSSDPSFHGNLDQVETWCTTLTQETSSTRYHVLQEVRRMLTRDSSRRPTANELLIRVTGYDLADTKPTRQPIFGECCANDFVPSRQLQRGSSSLKDEIRELKAELEEVKKSRDDKLSRIIELEPSSKPPDFPSPIERWDTLSAHWEGLSSYWIQRLEQNTEQLDREPLAKQMSRQITDLSAAGANLFHAVTELQRLRASSERKFQRWFYEHRQEQEHALEREAQLEELLNAERQARAEAEAIIEKSGYKQEYAEIVVREHRPVSKETIRTWQEGQDITTSEADAQVQQGITESRSEEMKQRSDDEDNLSTEGNTHTPPYQVGQRRPAPQTQATTSSLRLTREQLRLNNESFERSATIGRSLYSVPQGDNSSRESTITPMASPDSPTKLSHAAEDFEQLKTTSRGSSDSGATKDQTGA